MSVWWLCFTLLFELQYFVALSHLWLELQITLHAQFVRSDRLDCRQTTEPWAPSVALAVYVAVQSVRARCVQSVLDSACRDWFDQTWPEGVLTLGDSCEEKKGEVKGSWKKPDGRRQSLMVVFNADQSTS